MSENDDSLPRLLGGRYRLEAKLGSGGMGVVYRATDLTMHRPVAVKLVRGVDGVTLDDEVVGRFLREAKNTARVQHENIIEVYDFGRSDQGDMYFVMELLEGESLSEKLRREGKIAPALTVHIARQMCAALHVAHAAGIIHRDLKPANVMLVQRGTDANYVKVLDFGVAKSYTSDQQTQLTHTGMLVGTVEYMAPEQIMARTVDGRTDLYALGVVMYRMLTGKAPFRDGSVPALIHAHLNVYAKSMTEANPEISGELDRVILRCLAKQPQQRFESMAELSRALACAIEPPNPLVNLEYRDDADPQDATTEEESFDDATIKIDRPDRASLPRRIPRMGTPVEDSGDRTAIMNREELSAAPRRVPDAITRVDSAGPRECAMCRTLNAPRAGACAACGVSLANEEQDAVRARVAAPRTVHLAAPQMPPPQSAPYHQPQQQQQPFGHPPAQRIPGMNVPPQWPQQAPNRSAWQRFLSWTGIRS